ncbi:hypothetical protein BGZ61DRAFT_589739 [Ilyonectria robusta]|uniref:uncharacterized protein n=1 Tax=Ilyonectria robusta TaxID=1079257 RepID=UPI001E8DE746|nr:uncharacterized protein BGZ61DRAFT_589739 [Ilyonectria robusta]KAH8684947.1 hypothetical protein BGZ61DRAFT_589739 [Ilyonectria robusta]
MHPLNFLTFLVATSIAATDVITSRHFSERNYKGAHADVRGYGCSNVNKIGFEIKSIHHIKKSFCYAYTKVNCKGSAIYFSRDVPDMDRHFPTQSIRCINNPN